LEGVSLKQFIPVVPDFVIELRSATDRLGDVRKKMIEYQRLGVKLGLLINPQDKQVDVYELGLGVKTCQSPTSIDCGSVMPGFELSLTEIW
jgi:Uma2 family endonuclease